MKLNLPIPLYELATLSDKPLLGYFYSNQLTIVNQLEHRIEKIVKKQGNRSLVQWKGYSKKDNSWVDNSLKRDLTQ